MQCSVSVYGSNLFIPCLGFFKFVSYFRYGAREVSAGAEGESVKEKLNNLRQLEIGQKVKKFKSPASK